MNFGELFICFFFYSLIGWLYESLFCSILGERRFINRGFLLGPYCPIYGSGAVLCLLVLEGNNNVLEVFLIASVLCSVLEYATSYCMEKIFHARWWDYTNLPFQLHGRICLYGGIIFGGGMVVFKFLLQPIFMKLITQLDEKWLNGSAAVLLIAISIDMILTLGSWKGLNDHFRILHNAIYNKTDEAFAKLTDQFWDTTISSMAEKGYGFFIRVKNKKIKFKSNEVRFFRAFPNISIPAYEEIIKQFRIKESVKLNSSKKRIKKPGSTPDIRVEEVIPHK